MCPSWLIHTCVMCVPLLTPHFTHDWYLFLCVTWLIHVHDMKYKYVHLWNSYLTRDDSYIYQWFIHLSMIHTSINDSYIYQWFIHLSMIHTSIKHKSIWINKSSVNPKSTSNQSSKPCTVLQYPSKKIWCEMIHTSIKQHVIRDNTWLIHMKRALQKRPIFSKKFDARWFIHLSNSTLSEIIHDWYIWKEPYKRDLYSPNITLFYRALLQKRPIVLWSLSTKDPR